MARPDHSDTQGVLPESWRSLAGVDVRHSAEPIDSTEFVAIINAQVPPQLQSQYLPTPVKKALKRHHDAVSAVALANEQLKLKRRELGALDQQELDAALESLRGGDSDDVKAKLAAKRAELEADVHQAQVSVSALTTRAREIEIEVSSVIEAAAQGGGLETFAARAYKMCSAKIVLAREALADARKLRDDAAELSDIARLLGALPYRDVTSSVFDQSAWDRDDERVVDLANIEHLAPLPVLRERPELRNDPSPAEIAEGDFDLEALRLYGDD